MLDLGPGVLEDRPHLYLDNEGAVPRVLRHREPLGREADQVMHAVVTELLILYQQPALVHLFEDVELLLDLSVDLLNIVEEESDHSDRRQVGDLPKRVGVLRLTWVLLGGQ